MISNIRKSLNRKYLRVIVWFLLLALFGLPSVMGLFKRFSQPTLNSIAEVDGYHIDSALYKRKVAEEERRLQFFKQFGAQAEELLRSMGINGNAQELALNSLIQDALIHNCAEKLGIRLSSEYINNKLQDPSFLLQSLSDVIPPALFNETGVLDPQVLARYLQRQGIAMSDFEKIVEDTIQKDIVFKIVQGGLYVPGALIKNLYAQESAWWRPTVPGSWPRSSPCAAPAWRPCCSTARRPRPRPCGSCAPWEPRRSCAAAAPGRRVQTTGW